MSVENRIRFLEKDGIISHYKKIKVLGTVSEIFKIFNFINLVYNLHTILRYPFPDLSLFFLFFINFLLHFYFYTYNLFLFL